MKRSQWCCGSVLALLSMIGLGTLAEDCTITVQPGESIQAAIDAAYEGVVICLAEGEWEEHLTISRSTTLRGSEDGSTIRGHEADTPVLRVHTPDEQRVEVVLQSLAVTGGRGSYGQGILVDGSAAVRIEDVGVTRHDSHGLFVSHSGQMIIAGSTIAGNQESGVFGVGSSKISLRDTVITGNTIGVTIADGASVTVCSTRIENNVVGIGIADDAEATIRNATVVENERGGMAFGNNGVGAIKNSTVARNEVGIAVADSAQVAISDTNIKLNQSHGVVMSGSSRATVQDSSIDGNNEHGILAGNETQVTVHACTIATNEVGIVLMQTAKAHLMRVVLRDNQDAGLYVLNESRAGVSDSIIEGNGTYGMVIADAAQATLLHNEIFGNRGYGVGLLEPPCVVWTEFTGYVTGEGNIGEEDAAGDYCPDDLAFLFTEEGGEFDRRE